MVKLVAVYKKPDDTAAFDKHYFEAHLPLAKKMPGLIRTELEKGLGADGSFIGQNNRVSQSVPHLHVHVVPRRKKDGLRGFFWPRQKYESEAAARAARDAIRNAL